MKSFGFSKLWILAINFLYLTVRIETNSSGLHYFMDESELDFYFNVNSIEKKIPEYQVVSLKVKNRNKRNLDSSDSESTATHEANFEFEAFERPFHLKLKPNENLISPHLTVVVKNEHGVGEEVEFSQRKYLNRCIFLHYDPHDGSSAGLNNCGGGNRNGEFSGIILTKNDTFELQPLNTRLKQFLYNESVEDMSQASHLIKKVITPKLLLEDSISLKSKFFDKRRSKTIPTASENSSLTADDVERSGRGGQLTVETAIFFDEAAYKIFAPYFNNDDRKISEMLLVYMNAVQAIYQHPSLGNRIEITIVHMEIMRKQPSAMPTYKGERDQLLDSFCAYQKRLNPPEDSDANHWDIAVYVSGLDFYSYENGSGTTMGLATVRGVCSPSYACVIVEFGTTNVFGKPYPSAGFTSVYITAHEIGHNLGMSHDSVGNSCSKEGFIMSPSRGTQGETTWSTCSAEVVRELYTWAACLRDRPSATPNEYDAWKYRGFPGQTWSAKRQCELLLTDKDAMLAQISNLENICQNLQCRSPHRSGYYFAGPALEGTSCGTNKWCEGGHCGVKHPIQKPQLVIPGGWSSWKNSKCTSGCISKSRGYQTRRRVCDNPKPVNTNEGCDGASYDVILCSDSKLCRNSRFKSPIAYASNKCKEFSRQLLALDPSGIGLQAPHEPNRLWMGCAIFCRRRNSGSYYTPRLELNDLGMDSYFPDGTFCHSEKSKNYYCQQHHCLPEGFQFNKIDIWSLSEDVPVSANANPVPIPWSRNLIEYLSLNNDGQPLRRHLNAEDLSVEHLNEVWTDDNDYRELPLSVAGGLM